MADPVTAAPSGGWPEFAAAVAEVAGVAPATLSPDSRVVEDLGLDSLALVELILVLAEAPALMDPRLVARLEGRRWEQTSLGQLFDEVNASRQRPAGG